MRCQEGAASCEPAHGGVFTYQVSYWINGEKARPAHPQTSAARCPTRPAAQPRMTPARFVVRFVSQMGEGIPSVYMLGLSGLQDARRETPAPARRSSAAITPLHSSASTLHPAPPPPHILVLGGHAASLTPY